MWWNFWSNWDIFDVQNLIPSKFELTPPVRPYGRISKFWGNRSQGNLQWLKTLWFIIMILKTLTACRIIITRRFFYLAHFFDFLNFQRLQPNFFLLKIGFRLRWTHWAQNERNLRPSNSERSYSIQNPPLPHHNLIWLFIGSKQNTIQQRMALPIRSDRKTFFGRI
jgi:hypothetical protein